MGRDWTKKEGVMSKPNDEPATILHQVAETRHVVYADTDGEDDYWASFYSDWLVHRPALSEILGKQPVRSHPTATLRHWTLAI
jgi:hypothetical protein